MMLSAERGTLEAQIGEKYIELGLFQRKVVMTMHVLVLGQNDRDLTGIGVHFSATRRKAGALNIFLYALSR